MSSCFVCCSPNHLSNYGINCCRACAAFFRRTTYLKLDYVCLNDESCDISHRNRYSCRKCRLKRCLELKMDKHVPRSGEIFTKHISGGNESSSQECEIPYYKVETIPHEQLIHELNLIFSTSDVRYFPSSLCQQAVLAYREYLTKLPSRTKGKLKFNKFIDMTRSRQKCYMALRHIAHLYMSILPFIQLPLNEKWIIFKNTWYRFLQLDRCYIGGILLGYNIDDGRIVDPDGVVQDFKYKKTYETFSNMDEESIQKLWNEIGRSNVKYTNNFKLARPDEYEMAYLILYTMWNVSGITEVSPSTASTSELIQLSLADDLHNYYFANLGCTNYAHRFYKLNNILFSLEKYEARRNAVGKSFKIFNVFKEDLFLDELRY